MAICAKNPVQFVLLALFKVNGFGPNDVIEYTQNVYVFACAFVILLFC